jgi:uncharacterized protein (DUF2147 family)
MNKIFFLFSFFYFSAVAQDENKVLGVWLSNYKDSKITIKKDLAGLFYGEISWLKEPNKNGKPKVDDKNPEVKLQNTPILGLHILKGFSYDKNDKEWTGGRVYDPKEGNTYKCFMWFETDETILHVKGYIGFSFIGREVEWTKEKE